MGKRKVLTRLGALMLDYDLWGIIAEDPRISLNDAVRKQNHPFSAHVVANMDTADHWCCFYAFALVKYKGLKVDYAPPEGEEPYDYSLKQMCYDKCIAHECWPKGCYGTRSTGFGDFDETSPYYKYKEAEDNPSKREAALEIREKLKLDIKRAWKLHYSYHMVDAFWYERDDDE